MKPAPLDYVRPRSLEEAVAVLSDDSANAKIFAGGQSLGPMLNLRLARPGRLVDIRHLSELRAVHADSKFFSIGSTLTHAEIEDGAIEDFTRGLLPFVARGIAYRAVRNRGTIGGSLAHADPAADWKSLQSLSPRPRRSLLPNPPKLSRKLLARRLVRQPLLRRRPLELARDGRR
jgi:aerobic carbon-monoxide dehydrogenase medium subunit